MQKYKKRNANSSVSLEGQLKKENSKIAKYLSKVSKDWVTKGFECYNKGLRLNIEHHISILERLLWQRHGEWIEKTEVAESDNC